MTLTFENWCLLLGYFKDLLDRFLLCTKNIFFVRTVLNLLAHQFISLHRTFIVCKVRLIVDCWWQVTLVIWFSRFVWRIVIVSKPQNFPFSSFSMWFSYCNCLYVCLVASFRVYDQIFALFSDLLLNALFLDWTHNNSLAFCCDICAYKRV